MPRAKSALLGLKGCAGSVRGALCLVRSYANAAGIALVGAVVVSAISYVTHNALDVLRTVVATFILLHLFVHLFILFSAGLLFACKVIVTKNKHFIHIRRNVCHYML